jgi:putative colanic acid biosynthesis acetyltransferase WcaF
MAPGTGKPQDVFFELDRWRPESDADPGEAIRRHAWRLVERTVFRLGHPHAYGWRRFWLCRFGACIDRTAHVRGGARTTHPWRLSIGAHTTIADGVRLYNLGSISIGAHTVISQGAWLCAGSHDYRQRDFPLTRPPITVGSGVWIAAGAFVGPGVTIGDNSVIAARAVVFEDVPPATVVAGNPARVLRERPLTSA